MPRDDEALAAALEVAAATADISAQEQQEAAEAARRTAQAMRNGAGGATAHEGVRRVLQLLGRSAEQLGLVAGAVRRTWAKALADEGLSIRQIGERLGVSHQRVSALLARHHRARGPEEAS